MSIRILLKLLSLVTLATLNASCTPSQVGNVQAVEGRTESTQVEQVSIPYDPSYSRYAIIIEPVITSDTVVRTAPDEASQISIADKLTAQLQSALIKVGNFSLVDYHSVKNFRLQKGEVGPFKVRATITEFSEAVDSEYKQKGVGLGTIGVVTGIAGAVSGKPGLTWGGAGLAAANPTYSDTKMAKVGMVAFDVVIVDSRSGRIIDSFNSAGQFKAESAENGFSLFGIGSKEGKFQQSVLGQALRVALNDTSKKAWNSLKGRR